MTCFSKKGNCSRLPTRPLFGVVFWVSCWSGSSKRGERQAGSNFLFPSLAPDPDPISWVWKHHLLLFPHFLIDPPTHQPNVQKRLKKTFVVFKKTQPHWSNSFNTQASTIIKVLSSFSVIISRELIPGWSCSLKSACLRFGFWEGSISDFLFESIVSGVESPKPQQDDCEWNDPNSERFLTENYDIVTACGLTAFFQSCDVKIQHPSRLYNWGGGRGLPKISVCYPILCVLVIKSWVTVWLISRSASQFDPELLDTKSAGRPGLLIPRRSSLQLKVLQSSAWNLYFFRPSNMSGFSSSELFRSMRQI